MSSRHRLPPWVLGPAVVGLVVMTIAVAVKTAMGGGSGRRYVPIDFVQLAGAALVVLSVVLGWIYLENKRRSR